MRAETQPRSFCTVLTLKRMTLPVRVFVTSALIFGVVVCLTYLLGQPLWWGLLGGAFLFVAYIALLNRACAAGWQIDKNGSGRFDLTTLGCLLMGVAAVILVAYVLAWLISALG